MARQPEQRQRERRILNEEVARERHFACGHASGVVVVQRNVADIVQAVPEPGEQADEDDGGEQDAHCH